MWWWIFLFVLFVVLVYAVERWNESLWEKAVNGADLSRIFRFLKKKGE